MLILFLLFFIAVKRQLNTYQTITPVMGWLAGLFYFIAFPIFLIILNGGYEKPGYPQSYELWGKITTEANEFFIPFILIWVSLSLINLCVIAFTPQITLIHANGMTENRNTEISIAQLKKIILYSVGISFLFFLINIYLSGGPTAYFSSHWYYRFNETSEQYGKLFTLYLKFYYTNQLILAASTGLLTVSAIRKKWNNNYFLLGLSFFTMILHMIMSGNRIYIALFLIYLLVAMVSYLNLKKLIKWFLLFLPIVPLFSVWSYLRSNIANLSVGLKNYVLAINQVSSKIITTLMDLTEGSNNVLLIHIMTDYGKELEFLKGTTYIRAFTSILPRSLGLYTDNFSIILANIYQPGFKSSMNGTALGEAWANFGVLEVIILPVLTLLIIQISHYLYNHRENWTLFSAVMFIILAWMARSVFAENFQILLIALFLIKLLKYEKNLLYIPDAD